MAGSEIARFVQNSYQRIRNLGDPQPKNEDPSEIWCLGRSYDSKYQPRDISRPTGISTSPSQSDTSNISKADSAVSPETTRQKLSDEPTKQSEDASHSDNNQTDTPPDEAAALGWPTDFLSDLESRTWLTYRSDFPPIPRSNDPSAAAAMSIPTRLLSFTSQITNQSGFTTDTGWGCMIRSGQAMLANTLSTLHQGRDWRLGRDTEKHRQMLALFADMPEVPFSIQNFVAHGAKACGKHPGEWFGPSAAALCIQALASTHPASNLNVYVRPHDSDVYAPTLLSAATANGTQPFKPTLILLGVRLGIDRITPVYHAALKACLELPQSVGIAGGQTRSSHYFFGHQGDGFFYLDPHITQPKLATEITEEGLKSCHTRRVRRLKIGDMDPSMLLGFLVKDFEDFEDWKGRVKGMLGKSVVTVHEGCEAGSAGYETGTERPGAVDEVETWGESGDEGGLC